MKTIAQAQLLIKIVFLALLISGCSPTPSTPDLQKVVTPDHAAIHYEGRIDFSTQPAIVWQGTTIATQFSGDSLSIGFAELSGQVYFDVEIDKHTQRVQAQNGWVKVPHALSSGFHTLTLFKRNEASTGSVNFTGLRLSPDAQLKAIPQRERIRYIFYGDSITVGACNEDGANDQWEDYSTHNNALSYAALTAKSMNAEYRNISVSGIGISMGYYPHTVDQVWNRYKPEPDAKLATPEDWQPDVVFLNYGENDDSYSKHTKVPFPASYKARYLQQIKRLRATYPDSKIVILRGGMGGGATSQRLIEPWWQVVKEAEQQDPNIRHYVFKHWYHLHPRVKDHEIMASELVAWLKSESA